MYDIVVLLIRLDEDKRDEKRRLEWEIGALYHFLNNVLLSSVILTILSYSRSIKLPLQKTRTSERRPHHLPILSGAMHPIPDYLARRFLTNSEFFSPRNDSSHFLLTKWSRICNLQKL